MRLSTMTSAFSVSFGRSGRLNILSDAGKNGVIRLYDQNKISKTTYSLKCHARKKSAGTLQALPSQSFLFHNKTISRNPLKAHCEMGRIHAEIQQNGFKEIP